MRIIEIEKVYDDGHKVRFDMRNASNLADVYVDDKFRQQKVIEHCDIDVAMDCVHKGTFSQASNCLQRKTTYREESSESDIYYGTEIVKTDTYVTPLSSQYEIVYGGKKSIPSGLNIMANWQKVLFNQWKQEHLN